MTIGDILKDAGFKALQIKAIKKGYEGELWDADYRQFLKDFYGKDILLKCIGVQLGSYYPWDTGLIFFEKQIAVLSSLLK